MITERLESLIETAKQHLPERTILITFQQWCFHDPQIKTSSEEVIITLWLEPSFTAAYGHINFESESELAEWIESGCVPDRVYADGPRPTLRVKPLEVSSE